LKDIYTLKVTTEGRGPSLVFIHGVAGSSRLWEPLVGPLSRYFKLVRLDLLGYGYSSKPRVDYTPMLHIDNIRNALLRNEVQPPFVLVGLSMGCLLTLEYAKKWPDEVTKILNIGMPYYRSKEEARKDLRNSITARIALDWSLPGRILITSIWSIGRRSSKLAGLLSTLYTPEMARESMMCSVGAFYSTLINCLVDNRPEPLLDGTRQIKQSYLHGANDRYTPASRVSQALLARPNTDFTVLSETGHNTVILAPDATIDWILKSSADQL
jgi:pimeloyl-ACP methyl ester carboxylesterase